MSSNSEIDCSQNVFFDNFPAQLDRSSMLTMFERYANKGKILSFIAMPTAHNQYGMVAYEHPSDAKDCSKGLNGCRFAYWVDSNNFRSYVLHITLSGPADPYNGDSEYFTPFWSNYGRGRSKESRGESNSSERMSSSEATDEFFPPNGGNDSFGRKDASFGSRAPFNSRSFPRNASGFGTRSSSFGSRSVSFGSQRRSRRRDFLDY